MSAITSLCIGAVLFGYVLPEFILMLSPRPEGFKRIPLPQNLLCAASLGLIAYGVAA